MGNFVVTILMSVLFAILISWLAYNGWLLAAATIAMTIVVAIKLQPAPRTEHLETLRRVIQCIFSIVCCALTAYIVHGYEDAYYIAWSTLLAYSSLYIVCGILFNRRD